MAEITVAADLDSLNDVLAFVDGEMERAGCSMKLMTQVDMAVEEIFVNIARYAYHPEAGRPASAVRRVATHSRSSWALPTGDGPSTPWTGRTRM